MTGCESEFADLGDTRLQAGGSSSVFVISMSEFHDTTADGPSVHEAYEAALAALAKHDLYDPAA